MFHANQPIADFRGMFAGPAAATPPGTPALGGLPFHAFNPTHHRVLRQPTVFTSAARHMAPTAGYTSGTPPAFQPAPCTYAAQSMHAGAPVIDHTTHTHYPSPWSHVAQYEFVCTKSAGNDDTTDQSSPETTASLLKQTQC